jgi:hypothetical protein
MIKANATTTAKMIEDNGRSPVHPVGDVRMAPEFQARQAFA